MGNVRNVVVLCVAFLFITSIAFAGEVDVLVQKLTEKGILSELEAQTILAETKEDVKKQLKEGKLDSVPAWVQNTKFSGDLRLRFETRRLEQIPATDDNYHNRTRFRFRYGFETKVNSNIKVGARIATGSDASPVSTNVTLDDAFEKKSIWLDLAYLEYKPTKKIDLKFIGGKMKNPFWDVGEGMIFDSSVNPEGGVVQFNRSFVMSRAVDTFLNLGAFPLATSSSKNISPVLYGLQGGLSTFILNRKITTAVACYDFSDIKGARYYDIFSTDGSAVTQFRDEGYETNTLSAASAGRFVYNYRVLDINAEVPILDLDILGKTMGLTLKGEFIKNVAEDAKKDSGYVFGFDLGEAKDPGTWGLGYNYRKILADATIDALNDSLRGSSQGGTNVKGHTFSLQYAPLKNTVLAFEYTNSNYTNEVKRSGEQLEKWQFDCTVKF